MALIVMKAGIVRSRARCDKRQAHIHVINPWYITLRTLNLTDRGGSASIIETQLLTETHISNTLERNDLPMRKHGCPAIIDIEASGFGSYSYPIEIGVVKGNGERYCALIRPEKDWQHWCVKAEAIHGISRQKIETAGRCPRDICIELNQFMGNSTVYSDAWAHDSPWLNRLFFAARINPRFHLSPIELITSEAQLMEWDEAKRRLERQLDIRRHRASCDAYLIQQTYLYTRNLVDSFPPLARRSGL